MNFNTKEYEGSILKRIDASMNETMESLSKCAKTISEEGDKTIEILIEESSLKVVLGALKLIKSELIRASNINHNTNKDYLNTNVEEVKVMLKLASDHKEAMEAYKKANNEELYGKEEAELEVIEAFTPKQPTNEEIIAFTKEVIDEYLSTKEDGYTLTIRDMGQIVPKVKEKYPNVDGNLIKNTLIGKS